MFTAFKKSRFYIFEKTNLPVIILFCLSLVTAGVAEVAEAAVAEVTGVEAAVLFPQSALLAGLLSQADLGQGDLPDVVHEVQPPRGGPRGDDQVIGEEEALPHNLLLLTHDGQPAPGVAPHFIRQNLS